MSNAATAETLIPLYTAFPLPWRFLGYQEMTYQACRGAPVQAAGSCDICGTCIRHAFRFADATGRAFVTGCDCAGKASPDYYADCVAARKAARAAALRDARSAAAKLRRTLSNLHHAFNVRAAMFAWEPELEIARELAENASGFAQHIGEKLADSITRFGAGLSEADCDLLARLYREHTAPIGGHFGDPGKRTEATLTLLRSHSFETKYGFKTLYVFMATAGERIVWSTASCAGIKVGETVKARFTVTDHGDYQGTPQTTVKRLQVRD